MLYASYMKKNKKIYRAKHDNVIFNAIKTIEDTAMRSLFIDCNRVTGDIQFPLLTTIGDNGLQRAFYNCINITGISFPKLATIGEYGLESAFQNCTSISGSISFPELTTIDRFGLNYAFQNCTNITSVYFPKLTTINTWGLDYAFSGCTNLTELHFRYDMENVIQNNKFGASNATLYFDLGMASVNIIPNVQDCDIYFKGQRASNPLLMPTGLESTYYVYKDGYCFYIGSKTVNTSDEGKTITENITLTTTGNTTTFNITIPENTVHPTTDLSIEYAVNGIKVKTDTLLNVSDDTTQTFTSIKVPANTEITYTIKSPWHNSVTGTITPSNNTINITLESITKAVLDFSYPFTENSEYLTNLIDDNNYIIFDNTQTPSSCIVSGPKSYHKESGFSIGYIQFTTPDTDETEFLTLSVTCTNSAEYSSDYGVVFINTTGAKPTSNVALTTSAGSTNTTYGYILFQGRSNQSTSFRTVTKLLEKNTTYYLVFYYRKDGSVNSGWDRFAIQNIKIPVAI